MTQSGLDDLGAYARERANRTIEAAARIAGVEPIAILGRSRKTEIVYGRQLAAYGLRRGVGLSYPKIGRLLNRDHSTIIHSVRKLETLGAGAWPGLAAVEWVRIDAERLISSI
jgi:chromosomal replication initiation ATPase DnaA